MTTIFQCSFYESSAAKLVFVSLPIITTTCFATETQLFCTSKGPALSLMMFLVSMTTSSGEKMSVAFAVKLSVQSLECNLSHSARFS